VVAACVALLVGSVVPPSTASMGITATERRCGNATPKVQLTFDDGADPARVSALLDVLAAKGVRAGFFLVGRWAATHPALVARMRAEGHWLGNHSTSHADLAHLGDGAIRDEIAGGVAAPLLRPPYGSVNGRVRAVAAEAGYRLCLWDIDTLDWRGRSVDEIERTVWSGLRPGAVVLLHLHGRNTLAALPSLIDGIRARGFELDPLERFAGATVEPGTGAPLWLQRDGAVIGGASGVVDGASVGAGDAVAVAARPSGRAGRWIATASGGVHARGGAPFYGADGRLNAPLVAIASTPSGEGYWTAAADGGVFAHGDAGFFGSAADVALHAPVVALTPSPTGQGYWLLGADGGVFAFGDAPYLGSAVGSSATPFVALAGRPQDDGYWLLRRDGAVVRVGAGPDAGDVVRASSSADGVGDGGGGRRFLAIAADADGRGYRLVSDRPGEAFSFR
jgi:peptidoglycan/xylan/chitin deacetylase (PgdA/CDA1 family)